MLISDVFTKGFNLWLFFPSPNFGGVIYISNRCIHVCVDKCFVDFFLCVWISVLQVSFECGNQCCVNFFCVCRLVFTFYLFLLVNISSINFTLHNFFYSMFSTKHHGCWNLPWNGLVPLVLCVKDAIVIVHDLTLSTEFKLHISSISFEKIVLNFMGEVTWAIL